MTERHIKTTVNAQGLKCPMPVIKLQQAMRQAQAGDFIAIETTDKGAPQDIEKWAKVNKHKIFSIEITDFGHLISVQHSGLMHP